MGKRNKRNSQIKSKPDFLSSLAGLSLEELDSIQKAAPMAFQSKLQSALSSNDTEELLKANLYLGEINKTNPHIQSVFFDPNDLAGNGKGFKDSKGALSFSTLRRMGDIYIIRAIVNTRIEQVQNFLHFSEDEQKEGYTIRRKKSLFKEEKEEKLSNEDKKKIENIVKFLENGGWNEKWDNIDSFQEFVRKITFDSLTLDQLAFEVVRSRDWELKKFRAIDASLIRFLDTVDPRQREAFEGYRFKGYLPRYCMVWDDMIIRNPMTKEPILYYPWELGFGIRNKTSNIRKNGYGTSELETLVEIITWILWGMSYNGLFFKQGSQPKGFINVKNANISPSTLNEFRQAWMQTMRGVENSHRVPVINGIDLEWIDLQKGNRDMEFNDWLKFLVIMSCSVYRIDPTELGFQFKDQAQIFGQDGQKARLQHSREKGLKPILIFLENVITKYIVSELDEDFEFSFTGIEVEDEEAQVKLDAEKLEKGMVAMQDIFQKYSGRPLDPENDIIINQVYQTAKQAEQQQQMYGASVPGESEEAGVPNDEESFSENPFDKYKSFDNNPILAEAINYYKTNLYK
jgi:phage portal protein|uniref:Portal protein n=1 Tax=Herelleviridae sp. cttEB8 TaxID=2825832 RepID=A0A8S5P530_9CAUD|nr:MAG TPA: Portal protein [Herelleviridae sp. cttEB8]